MIVGYDDLARLSSRVSMVDGCFDPLHAGHVEYFRQAASLGRPVVANVQSDAYIRSTKGRMNLLPEDDRLRLIDALRDVDDVVLCRTSTADVLRRLRPAAYVKGADWSGTLPPEQVALCAELGIEIVYLDSVLGSSTGLVRRFLGEHPADRTYAALATSHRDPYLSGVAKFNRLLAQRLGVRCLPLAEAAALPGPLLVSVKFTDAGQGDLAEAEAAVDALIARGTVYDVFWHGYDATPLEQRLLAHARHAYAGNAEIAAACRPVKPTESLWCPGLIDAASRIEDAGLRFFSFGMAHKVQLERYRRLREMLEAAGTDYTLMVSTAFHEKASFGEIETIAEGFRGIFGDRVRLLGFLSDAAVNEFLARSDAMVAFFPHGVRANNTSVMAAMAAGRTVLTNLDRFSPQWMRHGRNVLDIEHLSAEDLADDRLAAMGENAATDARSHASWDALAARLSAETAFAGRAALGG